MTARLNKSGELIGSGGDDGYIRIYDIKNKKV